MQQRVRDRQEVFTPMDLCFRMVRDIPKEKLSDPNTTYLDNSCGDGNFLVALFIVLTKEYHHEPSHVLNYQLYGVDIMADNIEATRERLKVRIGTPAWDHIVCADALTYDYGFGPQDPDQH